jgi:hypothetical protein
MLKEDEIHDYDHLKDFLTDDFCLQWLVLLVPDGIFCDKCYTVTPHYATKSHTHARIAARKLAYSLGIEPIFQLHVSINIFKQVEMSEIINCS